LFWFVDWVRRVLQITEIRLLIIWRNPPQQLSLSPMFLYIISVYVCISKSKIKVMKKLKLKMTVDGFAGGPKGSGSINFI
jgi:hypothetical protein